MAQYVFNTPYYISETFGNINPSKTSYKTGDSVNAEYPPSEFKELYYKQFLYSIPENVLLSNYDGTSPSFDIKSNQDFGFIFIPRDYLNKVVEGSVNTGSTDNKNNSTQNNSKKYIVLGSVVLLLTISTIVYFSLKNK